MYFSNIYLFAKEHPLNELRSNLPCPKCGHNTGCLYNSQKPPHYWWTVYCPTCNNSTDLRHLIGDIFSQEVGGTCINDPQTYSYVIVQLEQGTIEITYRQNGWLTINSSSDRSPEIIEAIRKLNLYTGNLITRSTYTLNHLPKNSACPLCGSHVFYAERDYVVCECGNYRVDPAQYMRAFLSDQGYTLKKSHAKNRWSTFIKVFINPPWWDLFHWPHYEYIPVGEVDFSSNGNECDPIHTVLFTPQDGHQLQVSSQESNGLNIVTKI